MYVVDELYCSERSTCTVRLALTVGVKTVLDACRAKLIRGRV